MGIAHALHPRQFAQPSRVCGFGWSPVCSDAGLHFRFHPSRPRQSPSAVFSRPVSNRLPWPCWRARATRPGGAGHRRMVVRLSVRATTGHWAGGGFGPGQGRCPTLAHTSRKRCASHARCGNRRTFADLPHPQRTFKLCEDAEPNEESQRMANGEMAGRPSMY